LCDNKLVVEVYLALGIYVTCGTVELYEERDTTPLASLERERSALDAHSKVCCATYDVGLAAEVVGVEQVRVQLPLAFWPPHETRTEAICPIWLIPTVTTVDARPASHTGQFSTLHPLEVGGKGYLVRDEHRLECISALVKLGVELRPSAIMRV